MQARLDSQAFDAARIAHYYCARGRREPDVADPQDAGETWRGLWEPHDRTAVSDPPAFLSRPQGRTRRTLYPGHIQSAVWAEYPQRVDCSGRMLRPTQLARGDVADHLGLKRICAEQTLDHVTGDRRVQDCGAAGR